MIYLTVLSLQFGSDIKNQIDAWHNCSSAEEAKTRAINSPNNRPFIESGYRIASFGAACLPPEWPLLDQDVMKAAHERFAKEVKAE